MLTGSMLIMADGTKRIRETTRPGEKRRNPRFPGSTIWTGEQRRQHREERDRVLEELGLVTDRLLEADATPTN